MVELLLLMLKEKKGREEEGTKKGERPREIEGKIR